MSRVGGRRGKRANANTALINEIIKKIITENHIQFKRKA